MTVGPEISGSSLLLAERLRTLPAASMYVQLLDPTFFRAIYNRNFPYVVIEHGLLLENNAGSIPHYQRDPMSTFDGPLGGLMMTVVQFDFVE